jgi:hypothetical protein
VSRDYWARISVREHEPSHAEAIGAAVRTWQKGSEVRPVLPSSPDSLSFDLRFHLSSGWRDQEAAKSLIWAIGQANGGSCRVDWACWLIEDDGDQPPAGGNDLAPDRSLAFDPAHFPVQEPERPLGPDDWLMNTIPFPFRGCGVCASDRDLIPLGTWSPPLDEEGDRDSLWGKLDPHGANVTAMPGARLVFDLYVCTICRDALRVRLAAASTVRHGLFETDGNPAGLIGVNPDLACMACGVLVSDEVLVMNESGRFWVCRRCLTVPRSAGTASA